MTFFRFSIVFVYLFLVQSATAASVYNWPLERNFGISATFGESRGDHYHAGIDLSTNGETGLPVLAIDDGEIYRIKIQKRGYGRAVYVRHADGVISVYAHLESFSTELGLEQAYQTKVVETGSKYPGDIFFDPPVRVQRGNVIAFSGETGAGLPHLHLEIRRDENTPLNPLKNGLEDTLDPVPPTFQSMYLYPADAESVIDGKLETHEVRLQSNGSSFSSTEIPVVRGDFYLSVSVYDPALRPYHRLPHRIRFLVDGKMLTELEFNEFNYGQHEAFGLLFDQGKPGAAYYELPVLMTRPISVPAPFVRAASAFSSKGLAPGTHTLNVEATDANSNTSVAALQFIVNRPPALEVRNVKSDGVDLIVETLITDADWKISPPSGLAAEVEYSIDDGKTFFAFPLSNFDLQASSDQSVKISCRAPLALVAGKRTLIKARGYDGTEYSPYTLLSIPDPSAPSVEPSTRTGEGRISLTPYGNAIEIRFDTDHLIPHAVQAVSSTGSFPLQSWNLNSHSTVIPAPQMQGLLGLTLNDQQTASIQVNYVRNSEGVILRGNSYELRVDPNSLYSDAFIWPKLVPSYKTKYLSFASSILELGPRGMPLRKRAQLSFNYDSTITSPEKLSIYRWSRSSQKWESLPSVLDVSKRSLQTSVSYLDLFALIYDNVPPTITHLFPKKNSVTRNDTPKLAAQIRDVGMDVDDEKITFYLDGVPYTAEFDPDRNLATLQVQQPLAKGTHSFYVVAHDWGGNRTESKKVFWKVR